MLAPEVGPARAIDATVLPRCVSRTGASLDVAPELVGIRPGELPATLSVENRPLAAPKVSAGPAKPLSLVLGPTAIQGITGEVRRGQRLVVSGRGFLPKSARDGQATLLRL